MFLALLVSFIKKPNSIPCVECKYLQGDVQWSPGSGNNLFSDNGNKGWLPLEYLIIQYLGLYENYQVCFHIFDLYALLFTLLSLV